MRPSYARPRAPSSAPGLNLPSTHGLTATARRVPRMPLDALLLALAAAVVHAAWNLLLSGSEDTHAATAVALVAGALAWAPPAIVLWRLDGSAWPYIAASSALELTYLVLLATAYATTAMGFVYPIARGSAPVLVLLASVVG